MGRYSLGISGLPCVCVCVCVRVCERERERASAGWALKASDDPQEDTQVLGWQAGCCPEMERSGVRSRAAAVSDFWVEIISLFFPKISKLHQKNP